MNIAFGKAAADLAEIIDIFLIMSVPDIQMMKAVDLPLFLKTQVSGYDNVSIVEQNFWGNFKGNAYLVFESGASKELISIFGEGEDSFDTESNDILERETLMEVGNILIGSCVGKLAELLGDVVSYSPPVVVTENNPHDAIPASMFDQNSSAIILKTEFSFNERKVNGFLFLLTSNDSLLWLKKSLASFMAQ